MTTSPPGSALYLAAIASAGPSALKGAVALPRSGHAWVCALLRDQSACASSVNGRRQLEPWRAVEAEFVEAAAEVLDEGVSGGYDRRTARPLQSAHRPQ